jgi:hypothetical protein
MSDAIRLDALLSEPERAPDPLLAFAFVGLGVIDSLAYGAIGATEAVQLFFNARNCLFVRKAIHDKDADCFMSRGVQLPDLFTVLPAEEANREFQHELAAMRLLCLKLLEGRRVVA